jgi:hypothetical protein
VADLTLSLIAKDEMTGVFGNAAGAVLRVKDALLDMAKAAADSERVGAQLRVVAGGLTEAYQAQANVLSAKFAVDDEHIQKMQTILARYGEAPGKIGATTEAILNYAAATGQDAVSATEAMVRGVEKGSDGIKALGIHYKATKDFSKDLEQATEALGKRFAGAGEADANSMTGQVRAANVAVDNLKETMGSFLLLLGSKTGVVTELTRALTGLNQAMTQGNLGNFLAAFGQKYGAALSLIPGANLLGLAAGGDLVDYTKETAYQNAVEGNLADSLKKGVTNSNPIPSVSSKGGGGSAGADSPSRMLEKALRDNEANVEAMHKLEEEQARADKAREKAHFESLSRQTRDEERALQEREKVIQAGAKKAEEEAARQALQQEHLFERAGWQMGSVFVQGLVGQLRKLAKGGEFDVAEFLGTVFQGALGVLGGVLNFIMPGAGGIVSALGGLFRHDGGTIGYFHSGGMPATSSDERLVLAQEGEYMLSRQDVARMGGQAGVEAAKRGGGGGGTVIIQAVDAESVQRLMEGRGGRAAVNAVRLGRGGFSQLIRGRG